MSLQELSKYIAKLKYTKYKSEYYIVFITLCITFDICSKPLLTYPNVQLQTVAVSIRLVYKFAYILFGQIISSVLKQIDNDCQHALTVTVNMPNNALNPHPG